MKEYDVMDETMERLSREQKSQLLSGVGAWSTRSFDDPSVPALRLSDGPHGLRVQKTAGDNFGISGSEPSTCFPPAVAVGSSWDPSVAERIAAAIGCEARALGVNVVLGPGVNIKRSPLCGRNFEYLSEDPLLSGVLGAAYVRALQATGVGASVKHFAANNQETDRMRVSAEVDQRTLREVYFPAFERVVKEAQPATVMCAYNRINGVFASENRWLLTDVLRGEWGFRGAVVSDWGAVHDPVASIKAGLDLEMPGTEGRTPPIVAAALDSGELDEAIADESVHRVLALQQWGGPASDDVDLDEHHRLAREVAGECAVLLKNDGVLPLPASHSVAVIGEFARSPRFQGGGSSHVNSTRVESFLDAVTGFSDFPVSFAPGFALDGESDAAQLRAEAVAVARKAEVALVFAGLSEAEESEGFDRTSIDLPAEQIALIREVAATARKTVVVLSNGGVVSVEAWHDQVDAILEGFLLGQASGAAVADILYGVVNPSGRLAETIPQDLIDHPSTANFPGEQGRVLYGERLLVGYRGITATGRVARYPFGYGLSYTTFAMSDIEVEVTGPSTAVVRTTVTNTGDRDGAHVVQVYVDAHDVGEVMRPRRELRAFTKVFLAAGESAAIELPLDRRAFAYWDIVAGDWVVTPGTYRVQLATDAETVSSEAPVALEGDAVIRELTFWSTLQEWMEHPVVGPIVLDEVDSDHLRMVAQPHILRMIGTLPMQKIVNTLRATVPAETFEKLMERTRSAG